MQWTFPLKSQLRIVINKIVQTIFFIFFYVLVLVSFQIGISFFCWTQKKKLFGYQNSSKHLLFWRILITKQFWVPLTSIVFFVHRLEVNGTRNLLDTKILQNMFFMHITILVPSASQLCHDGFRVTWHAHIRRLVKKQPGSKIECKDGLCTSRAACDLNKWECVKDSFIDVPEVYL